MFKALDLDQNNVLDWKECKYLVTQVMKQDGGYDSESFKVKYDTMDKNDDGKISKNELMEAVVQVGRERKLFGPGSKSAAPKRETVDIAVKDDPTEEAVDTQVFRDGLSCLGKTFNNARHAYLKLNICDKSLTTIKVSLVALLSTFSNSKRFSIHHPLTVIDFSYQQGVGHYKYL